MISTDPNFIKNYFNLSRLHHISTWKADLCDLVREKMKSKPLIDSSTKSRTIMHVDMDCFFASVALVERPHLRDKPVAISHSIASFSSDFSSSEIASCNYVARARGITNGMLLGSAKFLIPELIVIPYEFEKYDACSKALYEILINNSDYVQAVSCDEAFIDVTSYIRDLLQTKINEKVNKKLNVQIENEELNKLHEIIAIELAQKIRYEIFSVTKCTASIGISSNMLLARLATKLAKPNNIYLVINENISSFVLNIKIYDLPNVGNEIVKICNEKNITTCKDIHDISIDKLQSNFGFKTGQMLYNYSRGIDERQLINKVRQSIGSDINYGIRFHNYKQFEIFLYEFSNEVFNRLKSKNMLSKYIILKIKKKLYEGEPSKYLGCVHCQDLSKSIDIKGDNNAITSSQLLFNHVQSLFCVLNVPPTDIRGVGIHLKKLEFCSSYEYDKVSLNSSSLKLTSTLNSSTQFSLCPPIKDAVSSRDRAGQRASIYNDWQEKSDVDSDEDELDDHHPILEEKLVATVVSNRQLRTQQLHSQRATKEE